MLYDLKLYILYFKKMSFIKVTDPRKREELIKDFIETRKRIKDNFIARKVGESEYQTGLTKLFKPVTETQKTTAKEITDTQKAATEKITQELLPIKAGIEGLPGALSFPTYPALEMIEEKEDLGDTAKKYLTYATGENSDRIFGIYPDENNKLKIGNKYLKFKGDNIIIDGKEYTGSPGLWELIVSKNPQEGKYTEDDYIDYINLLVQTNTIYQGNNPDNTNPKSSSSNKWKNLISPVWEHIRESKKKNHLKKKKEKQKEKEKEKEKERNKKKQKTNTKNSQTKTTHNLEQVVMV